MTQYSIVSWRNTKRLLFLRWKWLKSLLITLVLILVILTTVCVFSKLICTLSLVVAQLLRILKLWVCKVLNYSTRHVPQFIPHIKNGLSMSLFQMWTMPSLSSWKSPCCLNMIIIWRSWLLVPFPLLWDFTYKQTSQFWGTFV